MHGNFKRCQLKYFSKAKKKKIRKTKVLKQNLIYTANKALAGETNSEGHMFGFLYFHRGVFSFHGRAVIMRSPIFFGILFWLLFFSGIASSMSILLTSAPSSSFLILQLVGTMWGLPKWVPCLHANIWATVLTWRIWILISSEDLWPLC